MDEGKVLVKFYARLRCDVTPGDICAALYAKNVITAEEKADIEHIMTANVPVRMDKLLTAVNRGIGIDKKNFHIFLEVLDMRDAYKPLVARIKQGMQGQIQSL